MHQANEHMIVVCDHPITVQADIEVLSADVFGVMQIVTFAEVSVDAVAPHCYC